MRETEAQLTEMARIKGVEVNAFADSCVKAMLKWLESEPEEAREAINRAKQALEAERAKPVA